jgi:hypothetical protein
MKKDHIHFSQILMPFLGRPPSSYSLSLKLLHEVKVFMCTCFLYWLEVLSLVKEVCVAMGIIKVV